MFCDLVGSTALSARLDPEDLHDVLAAYQRRATQIVEAAGGRIARYEGDGVLAYFGYPAASEEDAERAVRAGLELAHRIGAETAAGERLSVRVGIASGVVVVGELLRSHAADNPPVVGETPNLAARLQGLAEPGGVIIAESTRRLTGGLFEYRDGGARALEGFATPIRVWHVLGSQGHHPLQGSALAVAAAHRTRCGDGRPVGAVGRRREAARAARCWSRASPASASPASRRSWRRRATAGRRPCCASSARRTIRAACCTPCWSGCSARPCAIAPTGPPTDPRVSGRCCAAATPRPRPPWPCWRS